MFLGALFMTLGRPNYRIFAYRYCHHLALPSVARTSFHDCRTSIKCHWTFGVLWEIWLLVFLRWGYGRNGFRKMMESWRESGEMKRLCVGNYKRLSEFGSQKDSPRKYLCFDPWYLCFGPQLFTFWPQLTDQLNLTAKSDWVMSKVVFGNMSDVKDRVKNVSDVMDKIRQR